MKPGENVICAAGTRPDMRDATADVGLESRAGDLTITVVAAPGPGEAACVTSAEPGKWGVASEAYTGPSTEDVAIDAGTEPEMGNMSLDAGTRPWTGDIVNDAGTEPRTWEVTSDAGTEQIREWKSSNPPPAGGTSFASTVGPLIIALPWASLTRLVGKQAQLLHSINSRASSVAMLQPSHIAHSDHYVFVAGPALAGPESAEPVPAGTGVTTGKQAQLLYCSYSKDPSAAALQPAAVGSAANYDSDNESGDSDLDPLDYQSSGITVDGKDGSGGRRSHIAIPAIMRRHLNCIRTVQSFKLSGGIFSIQPWINRRRGHLRFSYQLYRGQGRWNCPGPDAIVTAVDGRIGCIGLGGIGDPLAQPETASGDEDVCTLHDDDCRNYGGGNNVNRSQTLGHEALIHGNIGRNCREGNASTSEAAVIHGLSVSLASILTSHCVSRVSVSRACFSRVNRIGNRTNVCRVSVSQAKIS